MVAIMLTVPRPLVPMLESTLEIAGRTSDSSSSPFSAPSLETDQFSVFAIFK